MGNGTERAAQFSLRRLGVVALLLAALLVPAATAENTPDHYMLGTVPANVNGHGPDGNGPPGPDGNGPPGPGGNPHTAGRGAAGTSNLTYHNGPVMHTNTTYAIFWSPASNPIPQKYQDLINGFFQNVADASGASSNVYASDTQYYDNSGPINYQSKFGGFVVDQSSIPNNASCLSQYKTAGLTVSGCVLDSDIENLVAADAAQLGVNSSNSGSSIIFVFTPKNVGSCWDTYSGTCAFSYYCAYHSDFPANGTSYLYANQPYTDTSGVFSNGTQDCSVGVFPNGDFADATISVTSHEHNETITDPYGSAWYDSQGNENGDKCAWNFGTPIGGSGSTAYNQQIGNGNYYLQQEWSNASSGCVLGYSPAAPAPTITSLNPTSGVVTTPVTITGTNFLNASSVKFHGTSAAFTVTNGTTISTSVPAGATTGSITVTTPGGTATSGTFTVTPQPSPDFSIDVQPASVTVKRGLSAAYTVTITRLNGFAGAVKLSISGLPGGNGAPTAVFSPSAINNPGLTSTLTISTRGNTRTGSWNLKVTGTSGTLVHSDTSVGLTITT
jgi:hypothetical protein